MEHLSAYGVLLQEEAFSAGSELLRRVVAWMLAIMAAAVFLGLAGTALMLGILQNHFHWVLLAVPGVALILMVIAIIVAKRPLKSERFPEFKSQLDSDARALRMVA